MAMQMLDLVTVDPSVLHRQAFIHTPLRAVHGQATIASTTPSCCPI